jgi:hypothetical protein
LESARSADHHDQLDPGPCVRPERSPLHDVRQHARAYVPCGHRPFKRDTARADLVFTDEMFGRDRRWWSQTGSNRRPPACKAGALPTELWPRASDQKSWAPAKRELVGLGRFELPTSRLSSARSNQLSYRPRDTHLPPRCQGQPTGQWMLQRRLDSVGSSEKKEKRRRRNPARTVRPDIEQSGCVSEEIQ